MKQSGIITMVLAGGLIWSPSAFGITADSGNPYATIADRNVFSIHPPPPPSTTNVAVVTPPQKITLLGITIFGRKEVLFRTLASAKLGEAAKETSFSLGVGDRQGEIDVLEIDHLTGSVKVMNHGVAQTLTLDKDGLKPAGGPAPTGLPAIPGVIPMPQPIPGVPTAGGIPAPASYGGGNVATFGGAANVKRELRVTPTTAAGYAGATGLPGGVAPQPERQVSLEEHTVILEVARKMTQDKVDLGEMPPLPFTPVTGK